MVDFFEHRRPSKARLAVLLSGRGSNFQAIVRAIDQGAIWAEIAVVISNREQALGLEFARQRGMNAHFVPVAGRTREAYDAELATLLEAANADLICLAGYMRLLTPDFVRRFPNKILNIHPSLLPAFPGLDAQQQAWDYGVQYTGCTVHFVDESLDGGPIVMQAIVEVKPGEDAHSLADHILEQEHRIYPQAVERLLTVPWRFEGRRLIWGEIAATKPEQS